MAKRYTPEDLDAIFKELEGDSHRALIIVGASMLEHALEQLLRAHFRHPETDPEKQALFTDSGILGTFSEKIWAAYFMGLIGPETRHDFDMVRLIRNVVAHDMNPVSFERPEIANRIRLMHYGERSPPKVGTLRNIFIGANHFYAGFLQLKAARKMSQLVDIPVTSVEAWLDR